MFFRRTRKVYIDTQNSSWTSHAGQDIWIGNALSVPNLQYLLMIPVALAVPVRSYGTEPTRIHHISPNSTAKTMIAGKCKTRTTTRMSTCFK